MKSVLRLFALFFLLVLVSCSRPHYHVIIRQATIYDGTGAPAFVGDVGVLGNMIAQIGDLSRATADTVIEANGLALAPGFIDTHSHHDWGMFQLRDMTACTSQGISTIVVGQDGFSKHPLRDFFGEIESTPVAVNVSSYVGHNTLRDSVLGRDFKRVATEDEISRMKQMMTADLQAGALGLSTGLEYDPGIYSTREEVLSLSEVCAKEGGRYISHMRSEDRFFWSALNELLTIGQKTGMPVQISHTKLAMKSLWGKSEQLIRKLDSARSAGINVTADVYPYTFWQSTMKVLFPERNFQDERAATFALTELTTPEHVIINRFSLDSTYEGKTLAEVATLRKSTGSKTLMQLIAEVEEKNGDESILAASMAEADIAAITAWPHANICSDGSATSRHPRGYGTFSRVLRQYVREQKRLSWEEAIRKMTSLAAAHVGISRRGEIKVTNYADLVLFDPATVTDNATPEKPQQLSSGIAGVWVNGQLVFARGTATQRYPGVVIRRQAEN
ncbi:MAG: N-acyl-D-amino-acid deacylase family protein [Cyclobacteriaceae bacterium]|jgi:N-acyl-D-amino-acid deacylase